jgi:hypothetical protein
MIALRKIEFFERAFGRNVAAAGEISISTGEISVSTGEITVSLLPCAQAMTATGEIFVSIRLCAQAMAAHGEIFVPFLLFAQAMAAAGEIVVSIEFCERAFGRIIACLALGFALGSQTMFAVGELKIISRAQFSQAI